MDILGAISVCLLEQLTPSLCVCGPLTKMQV
jgi:hypothetical protein